MSKGSRQRPRSVDRKTFEDNWDRIFSKKVNNEKEENSRSDANQNRKGSSKAT
jgi:hypothetical protein